MNRGMVAAPTLGRTWFGAERLKAAMSVKDLGLAQSGA